MANYSVFGTNFGDDMELVDCNKPEKAIETWIALQKKYPLNVSIEAKDEKQALKLYEWANENIAQVVISVMSNTGYTVTHISDGVKGRLADNTKINTENLYPFCMGQLILILVKVSLTKDCVYLGIFKGDNMSWIDETTTTTVCELCGKETTALIRVKIDDDGGGTIYNVCAECAEKNGYTEYDGSDYASDWN